MIDKKQLCEFLVSAKKSTYASGDLSKKIIENDKSTTLVFEDGDFKYHDNYFGGEPFGGREVVFYKNEPVYIMTYYGRVVETVSDFGAVYRVLQGALSLITLEAPYRGPKKYTQDGFTYSNFYTGEVDNFFGEEVITNSKGEEVYKTKYIGGLVDMRKE